MAVRRCNFLPCGQVLMPSMDRVASHRTPHIRSIKHSLQLIGGDCVIFYGLSWRQFDIHTSHLFPGSPKEDIWIWYCHSMGEDPPMLFGDLNAKRRLITLNWSTYRPHILAFNPTFPLSILRNVWLRSYCGRYCWYHVGDLRSPSESSLPTHLSFSLAEHKAESQQIYSLLSSVRGTISLLCHNPSHALLKRWVHMMLCYPFPRKSGAFGEEN